MPEFEGIPIIMASDVSLQPYKGLREIDSDLVFLEKTYLTKEKLLEEIDKKMLDEVGAEIG